MLFLYRRALAGGADGAGRYRGGRGFREAAIPWTVPGLGAAVYVDESFPKVVGAFGANPGSFGHFRLKHGSDVQKSLDAGRVPLDFDEIGGAEAAIEAKGPTLLVAADGVWEWTGANAPGFGDPLAREPERVAADVAGGALPASAAERVYGVIFDRSGHVDGKATAAGRDRLLTARLAAATVPDRVETVPEGTPLHPLGGELAIVERDGEPAQFVTVSGGALLGPTSGNFKDGCAVLERPVRELGPEYAIREGRAGWTVRYREYLCPITGRRIDTELLREGDAPLHDVALAPAELP
jgi:N-methylhydantoinase B